MIRFTSKGIFSVNFPSFISQDGYFELRGERFTADSRKCKWVKKSDTFLTTLSWEGIEISWQIKITANKFAVSVQNKSKRAIEIHSISLLLPQLVESRKYFQYVNHNPIVFECGVRTVGLSKGTIKFDAKSDTVTVFKHKETGNSLLIGSNSVAQAMTSFFIIPETLDWDSKFTVKVSWEFLCKLKAGESTSTPDIVFLAGKDGVKLLDEYGKLLARQFRHKRKPKAIGWNSWDYYTGAITEDDIIENAKEFKKLTGRSDGYIIIDDGWQIRWGDWKEANYYFPAGLRGLVKKIKALGLKPGIWIAPYTVHRYSLFVREHPEALLRDSEGRIVVKQYSGGTIYVIDPTHPATKRYIRETFSHLRRVGFEYFKIDFTFAMEEGRMFYDGKGLQHALRESIAIIRRTIGKDAYLMSGCYSIESAGGIVDAARVSADIHNFWSHIKRSAISIAGRFWTNYIWNNDPDFLIVRCEETSKESRLNQPFNPAPIDDSWMTGRVFDINEAITWATIVILSGGEVILSDRLSSLNRKGKWIIKKVFENVLPAPARPIDLFSDKEIPSIWIGQNEKEWLVGIFNWNEAKQAYRFNPCEYGIEGIRVVEDVWQGKQIQSANNTIFLEIDPHSCVLLKFVGI